MKDYNKSIEINSSNENGVSYFKRGLLKEKIEIEACDDFVYSCDRFYNEGCERYDNICFIHCQSLFGIFQQFPDFFFQSFLMPALKSLFLDVHQLISESQPEIYVGIVEPY